MAWHRVPVSGQVGRLNVYERVIRHDEEMYLSTIQIGDGKKYFLFSQTLTEY